MRDRPLLSAALERIPPQLEASSEPRGSPQAVEEEPVRAEPPRSPKSVGKDRSVLRVLWRLQTFLCVRGVSAIVHIYTSVLQAPAAAGPNGAPGGGIARVSGRAMQDLGYELPRIPIPRTPVNKGIKKGRSPAGPRPLRTNRKIVSTYGCSTVTSGFISSQLATL